jgi:hypothetical protein
MKGHAEPASNIPATLELGRRWKDTGSTFWRISALCDSAQKQRNIPLEAVLFASGYFRYTAQ